MPDKPKPMPANLRGRGRYIAFKVISENKVNFDDVKTSIWHSILNFLGEYGSSKASTWISKTAYDDNKQIGLIRCSHDFVEEIRAALSLVERIGDTRVVIKVLGVSGTMKAARMKFLGETTLTSFA